MLNDVYAYEELQDARKSAMRKPHPGVGPHRLSPLWAIRVNQGNAAPAIRAGYNAAAPG